MKTGGCLPGGNSMKYIRVIKSTLLAWLPVAVTLAIWLFFRADSLLEITEALLPGFFVPSSTWSVLWRTYVIWLIISVLTSFVCGLLYYLLTQKRHWKALWYAVFQSLLAVLLCLVAWLFDFKPVYLYTGEIMIMAIGFGVFIPWFDQKSLRQYS